MINLKETRRIKEELAANPDNYQAIINSTDLAICLTTNKGKFFAVNDNYCKLYGYSREELVGNPFVMVVPEENRKDLQKYHDRFFIDKYEILRRWKVINRQGKVMEIFADAGYNDRINNEPHKITLIKFLKFVDGDEGGEEFGNEVVKKK